jgi:Helix-turn-helix domain
MTDNVFDLKQQAAELTRTFGCVPKVWNLALEARTTAWNQRHEHVTYLPSPALLVNIKAAGLAVLACGAGRRPEREPYRPGNRNPGG